MRITRSLEYQIGSKEEKLPYVTPDFPYVASRAELDFYREPFVPWHWHNAIELFYVESGELKYHTPNETLVFPSGSASMVNANVLHMTQIQTRREKNVQLLHIFDPRLLAGNHGSLIDQKYISPIVTASQIELIPLYPDKPEQAAVISLIREVFSLSEEELGYEFHIREALSQIWIKLFQMCIPMLKKKSQTAGCWRKARCQSPKSETPAAWAIQVISGKYSVKLQDTHRFNIAANGRITVKFDRIWVFYFYHRHYNVNQKQMVFTRKELYMTLNCEAAESARICISHAFMIQNINTSIGTFDVSDEDYMFMEHFIENAVYDDYDRLVQLCDALALPTGFCLLEKRFVDVAIRYGTPPVTVDRWKKILEIKDLFDSKTGGSIYQLLPGVVENSFY